MRYPDKPGLVLHAPALAALNDGEWLATLKMDGWRCLIEVTAAGPFTYTSRHGKPLAVAEPVRADFECAMRVCRVPAGSILDGEWLGKRPTARYQAVRPEDEAIRLFDILQIGPAPLFSTGALDRFVLLRCTVDPVRQYLVPHALGDYPGFYEREKASSDAVAEGIVLKRVESRYIGSLRGCADNPAWIKCKWRAGEDGRTPQ